MKIQIIGILALSVLFTSCSKKTSTQSITPTTPAMFDSIDALVQELNSDKYGMWINGEFPIINLAANAKPDEIIYEAVKNVGFDKGRISNYKIIKIKKIKLNALGKENTSAALIESDMGTKILLYNYEEKTGWWTRFYDEGYTFKTRQ